MPINLSNFTRYPVKHHETLNITSDSNIFTVQTFLPDDFGFIRAQVNNNRKRKIEDKDKVKLKDDKSDCDIEDKEIVYDVISTKEVAQYRPLTPIAFR